AGSTGVASAAARGFTGGFTCVRDSDRATGSDDGTDADRGAFSTSPTDPVLSVEATSRSCPSGVPTGPFTARATVSAASPRVTVGSGAPPDGAPVAEVAAEVAPTVAPLVDPSTGAGGAAGRGSATPPGSGSCCRTSPPGVARAAVAPPPDTEVRCTTDLARRGAGCVCTRD